MPIYNYKARDEEGRLISGRIDAQGEEDLQNKLENIGFFLVSFSPEKKGVFEEDIFQKFQRITLKAVYTLTLQLANTIDAGVPILASLHSLSDSAKNKKLKDLLENVISDLSSGSSLSESLKRYPKIFNNFYISMVELGESSGNLSGMLYSIAEYLKRSMAIKRKVIGALVYPAVLSVVGVGLVSYLLIYIMPQFISIFVEQGVALPLPTMILITLSNLLSSYWYIILGAIAGIVISFRTFIATSAGRMTIDTLVLKVPVIGGIIKKISLKNFVDGLNLLYSSGLPLLRSLKIIKTVVGNMYLQQTIEALSVHISEGKDLVSYLKMTDFFTADVLSMLKTGEESGTLDKVLGKISAIYEDEVNYAIETLISSFEMLVILALGVGVGFIAMAILFPMFKLSRVVSAR